MREILFRAKREDTGEWVEGMPCATRQSGIYSIQTLDGGIFDIVPETLCQYTGLTVKNGVKVWENDIIKVFLGQIYAPIRYGAYQSYFDSTSTAHMGFYVDWDNANKKSCFRKDLGYWIGMLEELNAVGNIFDNPELLEEQVV